MTREDTSHYGNTDHFHLARILSVTYKMLVFIKIMVLESYGEDLNTFRTEFQWIHAATVTPLCQAICQTLNQITSLMPHEVKLSVEVSILSVVGKQEIQNKLLTAFCFHNSLVCLLACMHSQVARAALPTRTYKRFSKNDSVIWACKSCWKPLLQ